MRAGKLRHRVTIQRAVEAQNEFGEAVTTWVNVGQVWASVEPLRGREYFQADGTQAEVSTVIRMRYRDGIVAKMRLVHGDDSYDIESVIDVGGRGRELELMCRLLI